MGVCCGCGTGVGGCTGAGGLNASSGLATRSILIGLGAGSTEAVASCSPELLPITPIATRWTRTDIAIAYTKTLSFFIENQAVMFRHFNAETLVNSRRLPRKGADNGLGLGRDGQEPGPRALGFVGKPDALLPVLSLVAVDDDHRAGVVFQALPQDRMDLVEEIFCLSM